jgi:hypothetical protein
MTQRQLPSEIDRALSELCWPPIVRLLRGGSESLLQDFGIERMPPRDLNTERTLSDVIADPLLSPAPKAIWMLKAHSLYAP